MTVAALIPAAGLGLRAGLGPKAFVRVGGRTLIEHAAVLFEGLADELLVAVPEDRVDEARALLSTATVLAGGATRQATVRALLARCTSETVLVHDAARPLAPRALAERVLEATRAHGAAVAALPVHDTLHDAERDRPVARAALRTIQTPQGFRRTDLIEAHERAVRDDVAATDDAGLVRRLGVAVALVEGSPWAAKLTGREDLGWIEALAAGRAR